MIPYSWESRQNACRPALLFVAAKCGSLTDENCRVSAVGTQAM